MSPGGSAGASVAGSMGQARSGFSGVARGALLSSGPGPAPYSATAATRVQAMVCKGGAGLGRGLLDGLRQPAVLVGELLVDVSHLGVVVQGERPQVVGRRVLVLGYTSGQGDEGV